MPGAVASLYAQTTIGRCVSKVSSVAVPEATNTTSAAASTRAWRSAIPRSAPAPAGAASAPRRFEIARVAAVVSGAS
jgi:hypothetical protein